MTLPGGASIPAVDRARLALAHRPGAGRRPRRGRPAPARALLTPAAFANAIVVNAAIGGSTNAVLHLLAHRRAARRPARARRRRPARPRRPAARRSQAVGRFLMGAFHTAGGLAAVIAELGRRLLDADAPTVTGRTLADSYTGAPNWNREVIGPSTEPMHAARTRCSAATWSQGAVVKVSAATPELLTHRGPALVFDSIDEYLAAARGPELDVTADTCWSCATSARSGIPGCPSWATCHYRRRSPRGVTDMVRISDARMSGTAYGTVVLHAAPEAAVGGPIALVRTGDVIELDADAPAVCDVELTDDELARRAALASAAGPARGAARLGAPLPRSRHAGRHRLRPRLPRRPFRRRRPQAVVLMGPDTTRRGPARSAACRRCSPCRSIATAALDPAGFAAVVDHVVGAGVSSCLLFGLASEFHKLSDAERDTLVDVLVERTAGRRRLQRRSARSPTTPPTSQSTAPPLRGRGAGAINVLPPHFLGPSVDQRRRSPPPRARCGRRPRRGAVRPRPDRHVARRRRLRRPRRRPPRT